MNTKYDSTEDTKAHITTVQDFLGKASDEINRRAKIHDSSKLESPEKEVFDEYTPLLKNAEYGSSEYMGFMTSLKIALDHHYANNSHHPQYYNDGISGMDLFDIIEMFYDWKAATLRTSEGDIFKSIDFNKSRFNMSDQLVSIFKNTADRYNF